MAELSLLDKALRVEGLARTYAEGANERREREQTSQALSQTETALTRLDASVRAARAATALGISIPGISETAIAGLQNLAARAGEGMLPSPRVLQAARIKLDASRAALDRTVENAWRPWATAQIESLPLRNKAFATPSGRHNIDQDVQDLTRLSRKLPTANEMDTFTRVLHRVRHTLENLTGDQEIASLLARLDSAHTLTLADLTDAELGLLRSQPQVADQIELRRR